MYDATCPICNEPLDESGTCVACGVTMPDNPIELSDTDLLALHLSEGE